MDAWGQCTIFGPSIPWLCMQQSARFTHALHQQHSRLSTENQAVTTFTLRGQQMLYHDAHTHTCTPWIPSFLQNMDMSNKWKLSWTPKLKDLQQMVYLFWNRSPVGVLLGPAWTCSAEEAIAMAAPSQWHQIWKGQPGNAAGRLAMGIP